MIKLNYSSRRCSIVRDQSSLIIAIWINFYIAFLGYPILTFAQTLSYKDIKQLIEQEQLNCLDSLTKREKELYYSPPELKLKYLLKAQQRIGVNLDIDSMRKQIKDQDAQSKKVSKYQDAICFTILQGVLDDVLSVYNDLGGKAAIFRPHSACSYCNDINADVRNLEGEYVLFINHRTPTFCYQMTKAVIPIVNITTQDSSMFFSYTRSDLIQQIHKDSILQNRFISLLEYFFTGKQFPDIIISSDYNNFLSSFTHFQEFFIVAHETIHAFEKHNVTQTFPLSGDDTLTKHDYLMLKKRLCASWRNEFIADYNAQKMLSYFCEKKNDTLFKELNKLSGVLFLTYYDILKKVFYIHKYKSSQPNLSSNDVKKIKLITDVVTSDSENDSLYYEIDNAWVNDDHPPFELRIQMLSDEIIREASVNRKKGRISEEQYSFFLLGRNLIITMQTLYKVCENRLIEKIKNEKK